MKKKILLLISSITLVIVLIGSLLLLLDNQKEGYSLEEKQWLDKNKNYSLDIYMPSDIPSMTSSGVGLLFNYIDYLKEDLKININPIAYSQDSAVDGDYKIVITKKLEDSDLLFYTDNYAIMSKKDKLITNKKDLVGLKIGVLKSEVEEVKNVLGDEVTLVPYENQQLLHAYFNQGVSIDAMIGQKSLYLDYIISNNYHYIYQMTDMKRYIVLKITGSEKVLNNIIKKNFRNYTKTKLLQDYNNSLLKEYIEYKKLTEKDIANLNSKSYVYGYIDNGIFDYTSSGRLKGINLDIIKNFALFANIDMKYNDEYDSISKLKEALNNGKIDFYFNNYAIKDDENKIDAYNVRLVYLTRNDSKIEILSTSALKDKVVLTIKNSVIDNKLKSNGIKTKSFETYKQLFKNLTKNSVIAIEMNNYEFYKSHYLQNYHIAYIDDDISYGYVVNSNNEIFNNLFKFYVEYNNQISSIELLSSSVYKYEGLNLFLLIGFIGLLIFVLISFFERIKNYIKELIKRHKSGLTHEEKLKYIDQLTLLKNRAYLNDHMEAWDNSEIYPQVIVIVDLNNVAYINDNFGHEEGDKVITEAANILIQTQMPNTEIIRTDGNEFLIYMVDYEEKKASSYIRKLKKELKNISHGYSAAVGYSIITDAIKTLDDAINEATLDMKTNKEIMNEEEKID